MTPRRFSLRWRLVGAAVLATSVFAVLFGIAAVWRVDRLEQDAVHVALRARLQVADAALRPDGTLANPGATLVQVLGPDGLVRASSPGLAGVPPLVPRAEVPARGVVRRLAFGRPDLDLAVLAVPRVVAGQQGVLVVALDAERFPQSRHQLLVVLGTGLPFVVLTVGTLTWLLAGRALRTVTTLTREAEALSVSDIGRPLPVPRHDRELASLTGALNALLTRLADNAERERRFAAEAGHQLRTPLATLRAEAELALLEQSPARLRDALGLVIADADKLTALVDQLLLLGAAARPSGAEIGPARTCLEELAVSWGRAAAATGRRLSLAGAVAVSVDTVALRTSATAVVENALRHAPPGSAVTVSCRVVGGSLEVAVRDEGPGIDVAMVPRLFEPWVSSRAGSGVGLGLAIARTAARGAGGDALLTSPRNPTELVVRLPIGDAPPQGSATDSAPGS